MKLPGQFSTGTIRLFWSIFDRRQHIESIEPKIITEETPIHVKIQRGLYYVHLYSALEKAVNEVIEHTILLIKSQDVKNKHFKTTFNVISLNSKMQSFKSCGYKDYFKRSIEVFQGVNSEERFEISNTIFSQSLQNIWFETLQQILNSFGASQLNVEARVSFTIDEVVEKRNAVAHGRETPVVVGERYRANILRAKTQDIQLVVDMFIDSFETYISERAYIQESYRKEYAIS